MFRLRENASKTICYMLVISCLCIAAIFLLTRSSLGLNRIRLFSPNALRSTHHHVRPNPHHHTAADPREELKHRRFDSGKYIEVVVPGDAGSLAGTVATVNSVLKHTNHSVWFHLIVPEADVGHLRAWLKAIPGHSLHYQVAVFPEPLLKLVDKDISAAELFLPEILPSSVTGKVIYLNNDVIVQADIAGLHAVPIHPHTFGSFLIDTHSSAKHATAAEKPFYAFHVNMMNRFVRRMKLKGSRATFSGGVFVADLTYWRAVHAQRQMVAWLNINRRLHIYGSAPGATAAHAAMLLVFYGRVSPLPPSWHLKGLGLHETPLFSEMFVRGSKLVQWSGHLKPWMLHAPLHTIWLQYHVPDPLSGHARS